jgi:sirohydrochlorin ferrochelatase
MTAVILLAHGSPDPRAAEATHDLASRVQERVGLVARAAFLQHADDTLAAVCERLAAEGERSAVVVPALLTQAFHARSDVPTAVQDARRRSRVALRTSAPIGTDPRLLRAMDRHLPLGPRVLATAGTRDPRAQADLERLAATWGPDAVVGHAAQAHPDVTRAIADLEERTGRQATVGSFVLFPGLLPDRIRAAAADRPLSPPLGGAPETVEVIVDRLDAAIRTAA